MMHRSIAILTSCVSIIVLVSGCGGSKADLPPVAPTSGIVTLDGSPAAGVNLTFIPLQSAATSVSYGATGADGKYELRSRNGALGAPEGEFKVVCSKWVMPDGSDYVGTPGGPSPMEAGAREKLPPKYSDEHATTLRATIPASSGSIDFELTTK